MAKVDILRKKYPRFVYKNYSWKITGKDLELSFGFEIVLRQAQDNPEQSRRVEPNLKFKPTVIIRNIDEKQIKRAGEGVVNNLVFNLGLIELLSYWKAICSPEIAVEAGSLNREQMSWWKDLINNGMAQFFYENKINFRRPNFLHIISGKTETKPEAHKGKLKNHILVPLGGGKDSIVALEVLKKIKKEITCFSLNPTDATKQIINVSGCKNTIIAERIIDKKLIGLNQKGFLNGHTPFSAYLAFLTSLLAVIFDMKHIAFSNERSSNEGNVKYLGKIVNHQYSKSFDFEQKFRKYSKKYLAKNLEYFSFLRPLYEIQIAKLFSQYPKYFDAFLSCNTAFKTDSGTKKPSRRWCAKCPKCLFVFMILHPFIKKDKLIKIFGKNLFETKELLALMLELIGERKFKPFECVGTKEESLVALYLGWKKESRGVKKPILLNYFEKNIIPKYSKNYLEKTSKKMLNSWDKKNNLDDNFENLLKTFLY